MKLCNHLTLLPQEDLRINEIHIYSCVVEGSLNMVIVILIHHLPFISNQYQYLLQNLSKTEKGHATSRNHATIGHGNIFRLLKDTDWNKLG